MSFDRAIALERLGTEEFDVLVVGGGITGAGVALDAASRGLRTALVERDDLASGTSSKSSKMVHGGLRYLQQKEYRLVYENLAERQRLLRNAPHLVTPLPFLIPLFGKGGTVDRAIAKAYGTALWLYDLTGGVRIGKLHRRIDVEQAMAHMPTLTPGVLAAGFLYYDARADDARLTLALARTAAEHGAVIATYAPVNDLVREDGRVRGVVVDGVGPVRAGVVVNATGVWADRLLGLAEGTESRSIRPAKGVHITVPWSKVRCDIAVVLPVPKDRRGIFVVPWGDHVYIGTTDTDYDGPIDQPNCTEEDIDYLLGGINTWVTEKLTRDDVLATWAGLRPLLSHASSERTADLSRRHTVTTSPSGLLSIMGGKLTTYRKMAADTVDEAARLLGTRRNRSRTRRLPVHGSGQRPAGASDHLWTRHGTDSAGVLALIEADPSLGQFLVPGLPYLRAEAVWAARHEMAHTLDDVLSRRTRARLLDREATDAAAADVAALLAPELGWDPAETARQVAAFRSMLAIERAAAGAAQPSPA